MLTYTTQPFTGKVSRNGRVIADRVAGRIEKRSDESSIWWVGSFRILVSARAELSKVGSMRLELDSGLSITIEVQTVGFHNDQKRTTLDFRSKGYPLAEKF